ncbi:hypothetical protein ACHAPC_003369 [Botrytis cinerea]
MIDGLECTFLVEAILTKYSRDKPELRRILKAAEQDFIPSKHDPKIAIAFWKNLSAELAHMCEDADILESEIDRLLANNLVFDRANDGPGEGCYEHCFLCTKIADDEMPRDATALDW